MQKTTLSYKETQFFSKLICDYLDNNTALKPFYEHFPNKEGFAKTIEIKSKANTNRVVLVSALLKQYAVLPQLPEAVNANIQALKNQNTFTVTTGHQLCLFTGPLYFIYKIVTAIKLAEELKQQFPDKHFVPVYWMATEDHDAEEINHFVSYGKKIVWNTPQKGAVGRFSLSDITTVLDELKTIVGNAPGAGVVVDLFEKAYIQHKNLADATRYLVNELFGEYGVVIIDGDDMQLKCEFRPMMQTELKQRNSFAVVEKVTHQLEALHYKGQVTPREINLFYLKDDLRERIVHANSRYEVLNSDIVFSEVELEKEVQEFPERFSPNVILRPLYQEVVLPNIAYIGGGGELAYWFQLKGVFDTHQIPFPVLLLRNSVLWVDKNSADKSTKMQLTMNDLFLKTDELVKNYALKHASIELEIAEEESQIKKAYEILSAKALKVDPTLKPAVEGELHKQLGVLNMLLQKMLKAEKQKQEVQLNQIKKIKEKLFPGEGLQERSDNFSTYYIKYNKQFIAELHKALQPLEHHFTVLVEE